MKIKPLSLTLKREKKGEESEQKEGKKSEKNNAVIENVKNVGTYWKKPQSGRYVPFSEIVAFSGGGIGVKTVNSMVSQISMSATCLLIGSIYKLSPSNIFILFVLSNIISVLKTPIVSILVDNTNTKMGKFRPYLLWAGIPCLIGVVGMTWLIPVNGSNITKWCLSPFSIIFSI